MRNSLFGSVVLVLAALMLFAIPTNNARAATKKCAVACAKPLVLRGGTDPCRQCFEDCLDNARDELFCCLFPNARGCKLTAGAPALMETGEGCFADFDDARECCRENEETCENTLK